MEEEEDYNSDTYDIDEEEDEEAIEDMANGDDGDKGEYTGARPRRLSEINMQVKIPPKPKYSSFFIFSHTNK